MLANYLTELEALDFPGRLCSSNGLIEFLASLLLGWFLSLGRGGWGTTTSIISRGLWGCLAGGGRGGGEKRLMVVLDCRRAG